MTLFRKYPEIFEAIMNQNLQIGHFAQKEVNQEEKNNVTIRKRGTKGVYVRRSEWRVQRETALATVLQPDKIMVKVLTKCSRFKLLFRKKRIALNVDFYCENGSNFYPFGIVIELQFEK